jgi:hypothetical protein
MNASGLDAYHIVTDDTNSRLSIPMPLAPAKVGTQFFGPGFPLARE